MTLNVKRIEADENLVLQSLIAVHKVAGDLYVKQEERIRQAYDKLRVYKNQHSTLVSKHRLNKLEYKELKRLYDGSFQIIMDQAAKLSDRDETVARQEREITNLLSIIDAARAQANTYKALYGSDDVVLGAQPKIGGLPGIGA